MHYKEYVIQITATTILKKKKIPLIIFLTEKIILAINFIFNFNSQNWDDIFVLDKGNVNETVDIYLQNLNNLLKKHAPLKKLLSSIFNNGKCITESTTIANIFNDFFHSVAPAIQSSKDYLPSKNSFSITSTSKVETDAIISSLSSNKSTGPLKILKRTQIEISEHQEDLFNLSFKAGAFPDILKIAKVIPIHKKRFKTF